MFPEKECDRNSSSIRFSDNMTPKNYSPMTRAPDTHQSSNISSLFNTGMNEQNISKILYNMDDETKRLIKLEFAKSHKNAERIQLIRDLLQRPSNERTQADGELLIGMIKDNEFFKSRQELKTSDLRDLANNF